MGCAWHVVLAAVACCLLAARPGARADDVADAVAVLRAVGREGAGIAAAAAAWRSLAALDAAAIPRLLGGLDDANPYAANWLRSAVDAIAARSDALPLEPLVAHLRDTTRDPRGRRLAWELIRDHDAALAEGLVAGMLDDPSAELRRDAVRRAIDAAVVAERDGGGGAVAAYRRALDAARDVDQIEEIVEALGRSGERVDLPRHFGFLTRWQLVGPFDNSGAAGFAAVYPPEETAGAAPDAATTYSGKDERKLRWQPFETDDPYGVIDLNQAYPGPDDGLKAVVAYASTGFESRDERDAEIRLGSQNAWKIWHNGRLVFARDEYHRGMRIDQYRLPIRLAAGPNRFLVKVCQDSQTEFWTKEWRFQFRVCDAAGTAILALDRPAAPALDASPP